MRGPLTYCCLALSLAGLMLLGCTKNTVKQPPPPDPLLITKKPIQGKVGLAEPVLVYHEPIHPEPPAVALATAPRNLGKAFQDSVVRARVSPSAPVPVPPPVATLEQTPSVQRSVLHHPPQPPAQARQPHSARDHVAPVNAVPAIRTATDGEDAEPTGTLTGARLETSLPPRGATYGRAADYSWLQGVLDRHYQGHLNLRYCDCATDDEWGGKVRLEADPRLKQFRHGDVILVEGELLPEEGKPIQAAWNHYPRYRVRSVRLVRSRD